MSEETGRGWKPFGKLAAEKAPSETLETIIARMKNNLEEGKSHKAIFKNWSDEQAQFVGCSKHPDVMRQLDFDASAFKSWRSGVYVCVYSACEKCLAEDKRLDANRWILALGVPMNMVHCSFANFIPKTETEKGHLERMIRFAGAHTGFAVLLSKIEHLGNGKTHLSIATLRECKAGHFITAGALLSQVRDFNQRARIMDKCKRVPLLVLDEFGLSPGYRDELPLMHEILSARYGSKLRTVINGNFESKEHFYAEIGERMESRLKECGATLLWFDGESRRPERRQAYLGQ